MTYEQLKAAGFDFFTFKTLQEVRECRERMTKTPEVTYEFHEVEQQVAGYTLQTLAVKQTSLTLKGRLSR